MPYQPQHSGLLKGGGTRGTRIRRSVIRGSGLRHQIPDVHLSDKTAVREQVWDFDSLWEFEYSPRELLLMTEKILLSDPKPPYEDPVWLPAAEYRERMRHEIYTAHGTPDPSYVSGLYWRTHPEGRRVRSLEDRRRNRGGFYK